jgi:hypothetical protein
VVDQSTTGPLVTDADFFGALIDTDRPGLRAIPAAVAGGDLAAARQLFAAEVRRTIQPERFLGIERVFRGNHFMRPGERCPVVALEADTDPKGTGVRLRHDDGGVIDLDERDFTPNEAS